MYRPGVVLTNFRMLFLRTIHVLFYAVLASQLAAQAAPTPDSGSASVAPSTLPAQSDATAVQAMHTVMAKSGGEAVWRETRSAEESFSVSAPGDKTPRVIFFLDDWSKDETRYRRRMRGQTSPSGDHTGAATFTLNAGKSQVIVPEFDQARTLVPRFPAAAAEVMLRRPEYILKTSVTQSCKSDLICVDIYRTSSSAASLIPEQQWKISSATGLPITIRYQIETTGPSASAAWREVYFLQYGSEGGLTVPTSILVSLRGRRQKLTFVSLKQNPGFDISRFDAEVAQ